MAAGVSVVGLSARRTLLHSKEETMDLQTLEQLIKSRRSIRKWKSDPVPEEMVLKALELATWAPNGGNFQNWRFVYISNRNMITTIADAVQRRVDTVGTWPEADKFGEDVKRWVLNASLFRHAPGVIAVLMSQYQSVADLILKERVKVDPSSQEMLDARRFANSGLQSIAAAIAYLVLALHAQGIGSLWMVGPLLAKTDIESVLKVPAGFDLVALVSFGWPDEEPKKRRKPLSEVVDFYR